MLIPHTGPPHRREIHWEWLQGKEKLVIYPVRAPYGKNTHRHSFFPSAGAWVLHVTGTSRTRCPSCQWSSNICLRHPACKQNSWLSHLGCRGPVTKSSFYFTSWINLMDKMTESPTAQQSKRGLRLHKRLEWKKKKKKENKKKQGRRWCWSGSFAGKIHKGSCAQQDSTQTVTATLPISLEAGKRFGGGITLCTLFL